MLCQYLTVSKNCNINLTVDYITCVDEGLIKISNLFDGPLMGGGCRT